jgi:predicted RNA binding protein YcfA (HicA-like mRNA interferase family)
MTKLPSSKKVIDILLNEGFIFISQKGSHQKFSKGDKTVIVPAPKKEIPIGTIKSISRQAGINFQMFINL